MRPKNPSGKRVWREQTLPSGRRQMVWTISCAEDPDVRGAILAHSFAREIGLPPGNYWEPAVARAIAKQLTAGGELAVVEAAWRFRLGLPAAA